MMSVLLICAAGMIPLDCQMETSIKQIRGPDVDNEIQCMMQSQTFMAQQKKLLDKYLVNGNYLKTLCITTNMNGDIG